MDLGIPPLKLRTPLESDPEMFRSLVCVLAGLRPLSTNSGRSEGRRGEPNRPDLGRLPRLWPVSGVFDFGMLRCTAGWGRVMALLVCSGLVSVGSISVRPGWNRGVTLSII